MLPAGDSCMTTSLETEKDLLRLLAPCARPVAAQLEQHLRDLPRSKQLATVLSLLQVGIDVNEHVIEVAAEAWGYLREHRLWDVVHASLSAFQEEIEFAKEVQPMLERHTAVLARMQTACKGIRDRWGGKAPDLLVDLAPPRFTRHVLELLHRLSKSCSLEHALDLLRKIVDARLATPKTSKLTWITQGDISKALLQLKITQPLTDSSSSNTGLEGPGLRSVDNLISSTSEASSADGKRAVREEQETMWSPSRKRRRQSVLINEATAVPSPLVASEAVPANAWAAINASPPFAETTHEKLEHRDNPDRTITQVSDCQCPASLVLGLSHRHLCGPSKTFDRIAGIDLEQVCMAHLKLLAGISLQQLGDGHEKTWTYLRAQRSVHRIELAADED